jgi:hypothetical protein
MFPLDGAAGQKEGGQALLGGLDCRVQRNFFGAQIRSFETQLPAPPGLPAFLAGPQVFPLSPFCLINGSFNSYLWRCSMPAHCTPAAAHMQPAL